jgi:hypothetical protein
VGTLFAMTRRHRNHQTRNLPTLYHFEVASNEEMMLG